MVIAGMTIIAIVVYLMIMHQNVYMMMVRYRIMQYNDHHHDEQVPGNDFFLHSGAKIKNIDT